MCSLCTVRAIPQPSARRAVKLKNPPAVCRSILRTFFHNPSTQPAASAAPPFFVANAVSQSPECSSCHMTQKDKSRNAGFISIAAERQSTTLGPQGPVKLKNPPAVRPVNPKNLFPQPFEPSEPGPLRGPNKKNNKCILHFSFKCDTIRTTVKEKVYYCGGIQ